MDLENFKKIIPNSEDFIEVKELTYGWSGERKFWVKIKESNDILVRILSKEQYESQVDGIEFLKKCNEFCKFVPKIYKHGQTLDGLSYYLILDFIEGINGQEAIINYTKDEQYNLGFSMGKIIKEIHNFSEPKLLPQENLKFRNKVEVFIDYYKKHKQEYSFLGDIDNYVSDFLNKISTRPMIMLHNDFHLGNMIINGDKIFLIDFNRASIGDKVKEFDALAWSVTKSESFAIGLLDAYLIDENKDEFFKLLKGYINIWQIQMLYFIDSQDEEEKQVVISLIKQVSKWYNNSIIPTWYKN